MAACGLTYPRMLGNPVLKLDTARMPTVWWLRPVMKLARVGEHRAVVWKLVYFRPPWANWSILGVSMVEP